MQAEVLIWIAIAVVAAIGEILTVDLFLAAVAVAALLTAASTILLPIFLQVIVFSVLSLLGIGVFRPMVKHALGIDSLADILGSSKHGHLIGHRGVVTHLVDAAGGQVRVGQGEFWTARSFNPEETIPVGTSVEILLVDGLTALVEPVPPPALVLEDGPNIDYQPTHEKEKAT